MRHVQITAFALRLVGLALIVYLCRKNFETGFYSDEPAFPNFTKEPSFRFAGIYLLHASRGFYVARFCVEMLGSLFLLGCPQVFARLLWAGITLNGDSEHRRPDGSP